MRRVLALTMLAGATLAFATPAQAANFSPPAPLDFGSIAVGSTSPAQVVTIQGAPSPSGPNVIGNVALVPGSPFAITATDCNVTPSPPTCQVTLTFTPVGAGPAAGTVQGNELNPATGASTAFAYRLTGTGTAPPPVLPEAPDARLLPLLAGALFGASFWILRGRATAAANERSNG
jgi:hypothetical protein